MIRAFLAVGGTIVGLVALLSFKSHPVQPETASTSQGASPTMGSSPATAGGGGPGPAAPAAGAASSGSSRARASGSGSASGRAPEALVTGNVISTQYGPMQVQVMLENHKITKVRVLRQTDSGAESQQIDASAIPRLTAETLAAQSAKIDAVSGASYTSAGYIKSLQSALDKAPRSGSQAR